MLTGVESVHPGYVLIRRTMLAQHLTGHSSSSSVRHIVIVSYLVLFFCRMKVIETLFAR